MKKKIIFLSEDGVNTIESNVKAVAEKIVKTRQETLLSLFKNEDIIKETDIEIEELVLDMSQPKGKEDLTDAENVQRVYNHMRGLSDSQASDKRIWMAYCLYDQLDYMKYRWKEESPEKLLNRYGYNYSPQRSLFRNGMARLWWIGRVTYDAQREDPYELTKFVCKYKDIIDDLTSRSFSNNQMILNAIISALYDASKNGITINRTLIRDVTKYGNILAGVYLLDVMDHAFIYDKFYQKIMKG